MVFFKRPSHTMRHLHVAAHLERLLRMSQKGCEAASAGEGQPASSDQSEGAKALQTKIKGDTKLSEVVRAVHAPVGVPGSPLFAFVQELSRPIHLFTPTHSSGLLPINLGAARKFLIQIGPEHLKDLNVHSAALGKELEPTWLAWSELALISLNWLFCPASGSSFACFGRQL